MGFSYKNITEYHKGHSISPQESQLRARREDIEKPRLRLDLSHQAQWSSMTAQLTSGLLVYLEEDKTHYLSYLNACDHMGILQLRTSQFQPVGIFG